VSRLLRRDADDRVADALSRRLPLWLLLLRWVLRRLLRLTVWAVLHPVAVAALLAVAAVHRWGEADGWAWPAGTLTGALAAFTGVAWASPTARYRAVAAARRMWVYRRGWQPAMVTAGLTYGRRLPRLRGVRSDRHTDWVRVRMLPGQTVEDWGAVAARLRQTFGLLDVRPRTVPGDPHTVELLCLTSDPLAAPVSVPEPADPPDLQAIPVGTREDGTTLQLPLLGTHLLIGGETGAGKGSVLWSLILGVSPAVRSGYVKLWVIDPKGGMELAAGAPLFDRFSHGGVEEYAALLEEAVRGLRARAGRLRGVTRKHTPTVEEPLVVIVVDELASLTAYVEDPALRRRIANALSLILSQGRAPGVCLVAATQDARKEVVGMRDLFPTRVALRTAEPGQADLLLGRGARERGARTEGIPEGTPGVAYVTQDDRPEPVRVRFGYADDALITALAVEHRPGMVVTR
jgi:S-DNA-T family DNA segregation ATPase FtsK/SpoIIIE